MFHRLCKLAKGNVATKKPEVGIISAGVFPPKNAPAHGYPDAFVADRNKRKAVVRRDCLLYQIEPVIRQYCDQVDARSFESPDDGFARFTLHNDRSFSDC